MIDTILRGDTITYVYTPLDDVHPDNLYVELYRGVLTIGTGDIGDIDIDTSEDDCIIIENSATATYCEKENKLYVQFHIETDAPSIKIIDIDYI